MPMILDSPPPSPSTDFQARRRLEHHEADVVVVGAGVLGCAAAITLARQGRSVLLLEKSLKEPDRIVGELLQPGGVRALEQLGLRDTLDDIDAIKVFGYQVIYYGEPVNIPYPEVEDGMGKKHAEGRSFHHGRFIRKLREVALKEPNISVVETTVTELVKCSQTGHVLGVQSTTRGGPDFYFAHLTIVADGYASKFRTDNIPYQPTSKSKFYGMELHNMTLPAPQHGTVVLGSNSPILLYQIAENDTRILVDVPTDTPTASVAQGGIKGHMQNVVLPDLPAPVKPAFQEALKEGKLRSMPNSWLPPSTNIHAGLVLLGDAMNMRHPLTGGGMTVALNDVVLLRNLLSPGNVNSLSETDKVLKAMRTFHWRRKNLTSVINILAQALYSLFAANDERLRALQRGCFRYFQLGGNCIDGPVGLLAGIIAQPFVLFYHFFSVALLAIWIHLWEGPKKPADPQKPSSKQQPQEMVPVRIAKMPFRVLEGILIFWKACVVIFPYIFSELRS